MSSIVCAKCVSDDVEVICLLENYLELGTERASEEHVSEEPKRGIEGDVLRLGDAVERVGHPGGVDRLALAFPSEDVDDRSTAFEAVCELELDVTKHHVLMRVVSN